jgi:hypothetical protein
MGGVLSMWPSEFWQPLPPTAGKELPPGQSARDLRSEKPFSAAPIGVSLFAIAKRAEGDVGIVNRPLARQLP